MKRILIFSLIVNVALLALTAWSHAHHTTVPARETRGESRPVQGGFRLPHAHSAGSTESPTPWGAIESADIRQFVANLRAAGCPEATIRDIVMFRVSRVYRARLLEMESEMAGKRAANQNLDPSEWRKFNDKQQDLRDEMTTELESVLGADWRMMAASLAGTPYAPDGLDKILSSDQRAQLREINQQFRHDLDELSRKQMTVGLEPDEAATFRTLERQKRDALAAVLSPSDLEEYLYRNSPAADYVRSNLPEAKSEAEYRTMVKLALEMEMSPALDWPSQNFGMNSGTDESNLESQKRRDDYAQRLKDLLGEDRIAQQQADEQTRAAAAAAASAEQDRQRMQQQLTDFAAEAGADADGAARFFDRLTNSEPVLKKKFEDMEKNFSGTPEEKKKYMEAAIKSELNAMATETMGDKGAAVVDKMIKSGH